MNSLDEYLPSYEFSTQHEVAVDAPSDVTDRALREVTFRDVPIVRALLFARGEGAHRLDEPVVATMVPRGTVVEDTPGEGMVLSVTGQFWRLRGRGLLLRGLLGRRLRRRLSHHRDDRANTRGQAAETNERAIQALRPE